MARLIEKAMRKRDTAHDIAAELSASVREMKAGKAGHVHRVSVSAITEARNRTGLSQEQFASMLGISTRTLQEWERQTPTIWGSALAACDFSASA